MNEYTFFKLFVPTHEKIMSFGQRLMDEYLYMSDEDRDYDTIYQRINYYLVNGNHNVLWEIGEYDGIIAFLNILPGHKANLLFKMWNPKVWTATFVRECKKFVNENMRELHLTRLESATADERIVRMAKPIGFEVEGIKKKNFMWNGKKYDEYILGLVKEK